MRKQFGGNRTTKSLLVIIVAAVMMTCLALVYAQRRRTVTASPQAQRPRTVTARTAANAPRKITVNAKDDLQKALDAAQAGDEIVLEAGAVYRGTFTLRRKSGDAWITIRSSRLAEMPREGVRVTPQHAALMPKLTGGSGNPVLKTEDGAHHYRLVGIESCPKRRKPLSIT
jgi:hypothetical protein